MSDTPPASATPPPPPPQPPPAPPGQPPPPPASPAPLTQEDPTDWKAEARKWEERAKANSDAAAKLKEIEDADKTEQQKLADQLQAAQADGSKSAAELLQLKVAMTKAPAGMPAAQIAELAARLRGSTQEELETDADRFFALVGPGQATPQQPPPPAGQTPVENLRPGALPTQPQPSLAEQIAAAEVNGDFKTSRQLKTQQLMELHAQQRKNT